MEKSKQNNLKLMLKSTLIILASFSIANIKVFADSNTNEAKVSVTSSVQKDINTWMPDKNLQKSMLKALITKNQLPNTATTSDINQSMVDNYFQSDPSTTFSLSLYNVVDFRGVSQYITPTGKTNSTSVTLFYNNMDVLTQALDNGSVTNFIQNMSKNVPSSGNNYPFGFYFELADFNSDTFEYNNRNSNVLYLNNDNLQKLRRTLDYIQSINSANPKSNLTIQFSAQKGENGTIPVYNKHVNSSNYKHFTITNDEFISIFENQKNSLYFSRDYSFLNDTLYAKVGNKIIQYKITPSDDFVQLDLVSDVPYDELVNQSSEFLKTEDQTYNYPDSLDQHAVFGSILLNQDITPNILGEFNATRVLTNITFDPDVPIAGGDVTANYVDENGNKIADPFVKSGNVGDEYSTEQKEIDGYTFKKVQGNTTGTFTSDAQTVTYVYTKNPVTPASPEKPVIPDNGKTSSTTNNNTTVNNTTNNNGVKTVKKAAEKMLPKTSAEKVGFSAMFAVVIAAITGGLIFKNRRNKQ